MAHHAVHRRASTPGEIAQFNEVRDREQSRVAELVQSAFATLGTTRLWSKALAVFGPVAVDAAGQLVKALHPESPGGGKITKTELKAIGKRATGKIEAALLEAFADALIDDEPKGRAA